VRLTPEATLDDVESALFGREHKPAVFVVLPGRRLETWPAQWPAPTSAAQGLDTVGLQVLHRLGLIRVFTKGVGQAPVERPLLVPRGEHVIDVASQIHKDFAKFFSYARVWRGNAEPIRVGKHFPLVDGDLLEIHAT
jgi:ribosome-interacting GTPase 1